MNTTTKLNSIQLFMLKLFDREISQKQEQLLADYFAEEIDKEMDEIWNAKHLTQQDLDKALATHSRTKY